MYNKKVVVLLGVFASICLNFLWLFSSAISLKLDLSAWNILEPETFKKRISPIHFKDHGNDFWWLIYFEQWSGESLWEPEPISVSGDVTDTVYNCRQPVEWFYYNEERWERLWPLDRKTADLWGMNDNLDLSGGIYTRCILSGREAALEACAGEIYWTQEEREQCEKNVKNEYRDKYWYYGSVEHTYSWQNMKLVIWTDYKSESDRVVLSWSLEPSLIRIRNTFPVWFVYDYNWWVWFVWCEVVGSFENILSRYNGNKDWNNYFSVNDDLTWLIVTDSEMNGLVECDERVWSAKDTLLSIVVEWIVWMSKNSNSDWYVWNQSNEKMQLFSSVDVNNTTLINYAKQKAESLCRWKWISEEPSLPTADIVCLEKNYWFIDASNPIYSWKTLIVKWWADVKIRPDKDKIYDIFVDSWNLLIEESVDDIQYVIKKNWFISDGVFSSTWDFMDYAGFLRADNVTRQWVNALIGDYFIWAPGVMCNDLLNSLKRGACKFVDGIEEISNGDWYLSVDEWNDFTSFALSTDLKNYFDESSVSSVINWNFIINWKVVGIGLSPDGVLINKYFIYWKFTTRDSFGSLEKVFSWRCGSNWIDTNDNSCLPFEGVPNSYASLSIIDQNYDSPLFK